MPGSWRRPVAPGLRPPSPAPTLSRPGSAPAEPIPPGSHEETSISGDFRALACALAVVSLSLVSPGSAAGQDAGLRDRFGELFTFGSGCGDEVLFCLRSGSGTPDFAQQAFSTNANATARTLTSYLQGAIALGIATVPIPSAGSGETFRLSPLGVPVRNDEVSLGPIVAERALTLGRGQLLLGFNVTALRFEALRGVPLDDLRFNVVQRDLPPEGPPLGDPPIERTYLSVSTRMSLQAQVANLFVSYGLTDRLDVSLLMPVVRASLSGFSDAEIIVDEGDDPAAGFSFGGPTEDPKLRERAVLPLESATGPGDLSLRGKYRLTDPGGALGAALLTDVRLPTGGDADFLGADGWWLQGSALLSVPARRGAAPHLNIGGVYRSGEGQRSAILGAAGVDHRTTDRLTLAADLLAQFFLGANPLTSEEVAIADGTGALRRVSTSNLPTVNDNQIDASLGFKLRFGSIALLGNAIVPVNSGGLRGDVVWTFGMQGGF